MESKAGSKNPLTSLADAAEDFVALSARFPTAPARAGVQEHNGFTRLSEEAFLNSFANGVAREKAKVH